MPRGYDRALYMLPFDRRASFQATLFGWTSPLSEAQTVEIAGAKHVVYEASHRRPPPRLRAAIASSWTSSRLPDARPRVARRLDRIGS
ncbi:MAG: hypothetical protein ACLQJR_07135 [Stellaceae bacterium]